jgi:hypothetical protein
MSTKDEEDKLSASEELTAYLAGLWAGGLPQQVVDSIVELVAAIGKDEWGDGYDAGVLQGRALSIVELTPRLAIEFGKAGFFSPLATETFLRNQARMMLAEIFDEFKEQDNRTRALVDGANELSKE